MDAARAEGLSPIICSSYRTIERQKTLFNNQVEKYVSRGYSRDEAEKEAAKWVAVPGTSEHHTGLAVDIVALSYQHLDEEQENTAEQQWLMKNAYKYGFILRYPSNKSDITGIGYEPWHYRYVGKEAAKEIYERDVCLEEYLGSE
jgi:D-alanyl-D-alanine carboxypeptidase